MDRPPSDLVFDWNGAAAPPPDGTAIVFDDETLRDGLQSPSARNPTLEEKVDFLRLAAEVGVRAADLGLPGAGERAVADVEALCRLIAEERLPITPNCAARTADADLRPVLGLVERLGRPLEVMLFLACSPIRLRVEGWDEPELVTRAAEFVAMAVRGGAPVTFVAEDSTRAAPEALRRLFLTAADHGAGRVCIADTAGHATPFGAWSIVRAVRRMLDDAGFATVGIDWHGHNDRGLATANTLAAGWAGATRLHGTALGVGERVGNAAMEQLLGNARLLGWTGFDLEHLGAYAAHAARMVGMPIPPGAPLVGRDAFRTSTGVHAAAIVKAGAGGTGSVALQDLVYSAVPAAWLGRRQEIEVGPMSGGANIRAWLRDRGYEDGGEVTARILEAAKLADRTLTEGELEDLADRPLPGAGE